ncbi:MAG: cation transporter, partial [Chlamydiia bacterium]|nr:cation transporter [Chlamydiia bacterium]
VRTAALRVPGVRETEKIHLQVYGPDALVGIDIEVDPKMPVDEAHDITQKVRAEIQKDWPAVRDVIVHVEPYYPGDH